MPRLAPCPRHGLQTVGVDNKGWRYCCVAGCGWQAPAFNPARRTDKEEIAFLRLQLERDPLLLAFIADGIVLGDDTDTGHR